MFLDSLYFIYNDYTLLYTWKKNTKNMFAIWSWTKYVNILEPFEFETFFVLPTSKKNQISSLCTDLVMNAYICWREMYQIIFQIIMSGVI